MNLPQSKSRVDRHASSAPEPVMARPVRPVSEEPGFGGLSEGGVLAARARPCPGAFPRWSPTCRLPGARCGRRGGRVLDRNRRTDDTRISPGEAALRSCPVRTGQSGPRHRQLLTPTGSGAGGSGGIVAPLSSANAATAFVPARAPTREACRTDLCPRWTGRRRAPCCCRVAPGTMPCDRRARPARGVPTARRWRVRRRSR